MLGKDQRILRALVVVYLLHFHLVFGDVALPVAEFPYLHVSRHFQFPSMMMLTVITIHKLAFTIIRLILIFLRRTTTIGTP